ncbi:type I-E CRISPR-associated protein Cas5/CasD [Acetobacteraceae bacterium ESL0709]|nr:type I-E CRISPR-associated protein Cas5/CasD [Acetobacteraceae bacterium ESL0697]MDF7677514.1 type I-E CRISPR-associated protein Cas5/CasD [Acetobacteraceae bacterium ESL0709]
MARFLTFALVAPMASFGDIAAGGFRDGVLRPARSALLGLIAGCLGLTREEETEHRALSDHYGIALLCYNNGDLLIDYHTAQMAPAMRKRVYATRAAELAVDPTELSTVLSYRDYRTGSWHLAALWLRDDKGPWTLEELQNALNRPVFTPYWGRKSCPFSLPFTPEIMEEETAAQALLERHASGKESQLFYGARFRKEEQSLKDDAEGDEESAEEKKEEKAPAAYLFFRNRQSGQKDNSAMTIVMDARDVERQGGACVLSRRENRRDQPLSRTRWEFGLREEAVLTVPSSKLLSPKASMSEAEVQS